MPDFTTYQPPGVYVDEETSSLVVATTGVRPAVVAIVGPAVGYRIGTESIVFSDDSPTPLARLGIDTTTVEVRSAGGTLYAAPTDFDLAVGAGEDAITPSPDDVTSIIWESTGGITLGQTVFISYRYTDPTYYDPFRFTDLDDIQDAYGPAIDSATGDVISHLSFAARMALENGARQIVCVATVGNIDVAVVPSDLTSAYVKIANLTDVSLVVPLPVGIGDADIATVIGGLTTHTSNASSDGNFRIGVVGAETSVTLDPDSLAGASASARVVLAWPNRLNYYHGPTNQTLVVGGYYLAASYAGRLVSLQSHVPLTRKRIYGFSGLPSTVLQSMSRANKDLWSSSGVAVTEPNRQNQMVVRHGVTTSIANIHTREISLVRARDTLVALLQETMEGADLIGSFINDDTPGRVKAIVAGVLEQAINTDTIVAYTDLKVRQLISDPTIIEVKFQYRPSYPLNYIVIAFSVNTNTGETTILNQATGV